MSPLCQHLFLIHCETTCGHIGSPSTRAKVSFSRALLCIIPRSISGFLFARHAQQHSAKAKTKGTRLILANVHTHQHEMETPASSPPLREHFYTQEEYTKRKAGWLQKVYKARLREQNKKDAEEVFGSNKTLKAKDIAQAELASQTIKCIPHTYTDGELIFLTAPITREEYEAKRLRVHGALQDVLAGHTANIHALIVFRGSVGELSVLEIRRREEEDVGVLGDSPGEITDLLPLPTEDMYEQDPLAFRAAAPAQPRKKGKGKAKVPDDGGKSIFPLPIWERLLSSGAINPANTTPSPEPPHLAASQDHSGAGPTKAPLRPLLPALFPAHRGVTTTRPPHTTDSTASPPVQDTPAPPLSAEQRITAIAAGTLLPANPPEAQLAATHRLALLTAAASKRFSARVLARQFLGREFAPSKRSNKVFCVCGDTACDAGDKRPWVACDGDGCGVWQHEACVRGALPDGWEEMRRKEQEGVRYLCQQCDPWAHRVMLRALRAKNVV